MNYRLVLRTMVSGLPWQHDFDVASDDMAKEFVSRHLSQPTTLPACAMGADLFAEPGLPGERHVASFVVRPTIVVTQQ